MRPKHSNKTPEIEILEDSLKALHRRCSALQAEVDRGSAKIIRAISLINTPEKAASAVQIYNLVWFEKQLFSMDRLREIASVLIVNTRPFHVKNPFWDNIVNNRITIDLPLTNIRKNANIASLKRMNAIEPQTDLGVDFTQPVVEDEQKESPDEAVEPKE